MKKKIVISNNLINLNSTNKRCVYLSTQIFVKEIVKHNQRTASENLFADVFNKQKKKKQFSFLLIKI